MNESVSKIFDLWERAKKIYLSVLQNEADISQADRYLKMVTRVELKDDQLKIFTSYDHIAKILKDEYSEKLKSSLELAGLDKNIRLEILIDDNFKPKAVAPLKASKTDKKEIKPEEPVFESTMPLNDEYCFDEFVTGPSNSWAYAAAKGVASNPGKKGFNPLFIHGGTGLGKTHLMQAIGNDIKKNNPKAAVCYLTAERLMNEYINSLTSHNINEFRNRYRKIDILLVDDIQFMSKGTNFQEEFFNTFNSLHQADKQIVMTSDVAPKDLPNIEARLIGRFEWGMVQEIEMPSYETRLAILRKKTENSEQPVPDEILKFIASNIKSHVRAMEGALGKVSMMLQFNPKMLPNDDFLGHALKDFIDKEKSQRKITIEEIQNSVAKKYSVSMSSILSTERTASIVTPRQLAMFIARKFTQFNLPEIASKFEKTHATILHGVKAIDKRLDVEPELKKNLEEILNDFGLTMEDKVD